MATIITDLKETFRRGNIYIQLIYINVAVFILTTLTEVMFQLFNRSIAGVFEWLELPASVIRFILQPWSLLTYMFMHAGFMHILFNMLWLYWFGALFLSFFSAKHLRGVYILGGICGGLLYMAAYNIFPYFRPMTDYSFMLGASASVLAIVAATAYREPNYPIRLNVVRNNPRANLPVSDTATAVRNHPAEIPGTHRYRHRFTVHHLQQCRWTHRTFRRCAGRGMVCRQPQQR